MSQIFQKFLEDSENSRLREQIVEYKFLSDLLLSFASKGIKLEIQRSEHDSFGYDIVLKIGEEIRFVQMKAKLGSGSTPRWTIHKSLIQNPFGTVIVAYLYYYDDKLELQYRGLPFDKKDKVFNQAHNKIKDSSKEKYCNLNENDLVKLNSIDEVLSFLFKNIC